MMLLLLTRIGLTMMFLQTMLTKALEGAVLSISLLQTSTYLDMSLPGTGLHRTRAFLY